MPNIDKIIINGTSYDIADMGARTDVSIALTNADAAMRTAQNAVSYAAPQTISDTGKATARGNIGAASEKDIDNIYAIDDCMNGNNVIGVTNFTNSISVNGATAEYYNGKIKLYGTCAAVRMLLCLNGQAAVKTSTGVFAQTLPAGTYRVRVSATGNLPADYAGAILTYTTTTFADRQYLLDGDVLVTEEPVMVAFYVRAVNYGTSDNPTYVEISVTEYNEKADVDKSLILPTGDNTDRSAEIVSKLSEFGRVCLGKGDFYVSGISMPESSMLCGFGASTRVRLIDNAEGAAITMGNACTVQDLSVYGSDAAITLDGYFAGSENNDSASHNYWSSGDQTFTQYTQFVLPEPLPPGEYKLTCTVVSDGTSLNTSTIAFFRSQTSAISSNDLIVSMQVTRGSAQTVYFTLTETAYSVRLYAESTLSNSEGDNATWSNISVVKQNSRCGIAWKGSSVHYGMLHNCRVYHFNCAGLILQDTMTPSDTHLLVSDCVFEDCNVGIYVRRDSEFNKIVNCTVIKNYYGALIRGGNNYITNCGFEKNTIGVQLDADEGANGGHGAISNCSINHSNNNTGYGLIIRDTGRELISNCNFYFSKIRLQHTDGNVLSSCGSGNSSGLEIIDGYCSLIIGFMAKSGDFPITVTNNTAAKIVNSYYRTGTQIVMPS